MSSTQTLLKPQGKQNTWSSTFPNETVTEQKSALFVKKLLAVAVSNITYLRAIFPEVAYGDRCLEDLNLKILKDESECQGACQVIKWVKGCFDALDKKFLRVLIIGIYTDPNNPETVIESYTFKFSYAENTGIDIYRNKQKISSAYTAAETKKATMQLLRTIVVLTQSLKSLPDNVMMTMKLLYYDDVTPGDYEPPGFCHSESDVFHFDEKPMNIKVGDVATPFHTVKLRIKTDPKQFEEVAEEEEQVEDTEDAATVAETNSVAASEISKHTPLGEKEISNTGLDLTEDDQKEDREVSKKNKKGKKGKLSKTNKDCNEQIVPHSPPAPNEDAASIPDDVQANDPEQAVDTTGSQVSNTESQLSQMEDVPKDFGVRCGCGLNEDDGLMILCAQCRYWQHGVCFKIIEDEEAPERHICNQCGDPENPELIPTDPSLQNLLELALQATCLWRRALLSCTEATKVMAPGMAKRLGVEMTVAQGLVFRLEKEGFLKTGTKSKKLAKPVDKEKLRSGIKKYFRKANSSRNDDTTVEDENMEINAPSSQKTAYKTKEISDIEKLTLKAKALDVSGKKKAVLPTKATGKSDMRSKAGNKRVRSVMDNDAYEFDVEDTEELSQEPKVKKIKKASVASIPLKV